MTVSTYLPCEALSPFINKYIIVEVDEERTNRILPDTSIALAFRLRGSTSYRTDANLIGIPPAVVTGLRRDARLICYSENAASLIVSFKEMGAAAFFDVPLHELFGESVPLETITGASTVAWVEEEIASSPNDRMRITVVERFLTSILNPRCSDSLVASSLNIMTKAKGMIRMGDLFKELYISQDAFEKRFRKTIGATPKQFAKLVKLKSLLKQQTPVSSFTQLALGAGYYDSAHFNKDFKVFTGLSPKEFFQSSNVW